VGHDEINHREQGLKTRVVDYIGQSWFSGGNGSVPALHVMPATFTFLHACLLLWTSLLQLGSAVPLKRADSCPGYKASNVQQSDSSLTADLTLAGTACNTYGKDLQDLKFSAQWQTGMSSLLSSDARERVGVI
jgi:alpha-glucosidase